MPERATKQRAARDKRQGKAPSTQAGEFVREEIHHVREGKHGARNTRQAIAIGLSKARRSGVSLPPPKRGTRSVKERAKHELESAPHEPSRRRSRATLKALQKEPHDAASSPQLSRQAERSAARRSAADRSRAATRAAKTKGASGRRKAARKAAKTRQQSR